MAYKEIWLPGEKDAHTILKAQDFFCYRENFMWGRQLAYTNADKTAFRFVDKGEIITPQEMHARLKLDWRPVARAEQDYFCNGLDELLKLPA